MATLLQMCSRNCEFYFYQTIDIKLSGVRERYNCDVSRLAAIILIDLYSKHQMIDIQDPLVRVCFLRNVVSLLGVKSSQIEAAYVDEKFAKFVIQPGELERRGCHS